MADNTQVGSGTGDTVRDKDRAGVKTQIVGLDLGIGTGSESLMSGSLPVTLAVTDTAGTLSSVSLAVTSFTVLAANSSRKGALFFNDSTNILYLSLASTTSTTSYSVQLAPSQFYELPAGLNYRAIVTGISATASGSVRVTELT